MLSISDYPTFVIDIENRMIPILKAYILAANNALNLWVTRYVDFRKISQRMMGQNTPVKCFLDFANTKPLDITNYQQQVNQAIEYKHKSLQIVNSVYAGDFYFTQYIFLAIFRMQSAMAAVFINSAVFEFSKATDNRHHRLSLIRACAEVERGTVKFDTHENFVVDESLLHCLSTPIPVFKPFSVDQVLKADPATATLLRFGIDSCKKFAAITI